ncbi:MAG: hypothetical protein KAI25_15495, partial [Hyphomicrobiaceae bacterium]|nr:hypothetical protein [Hyphomicrobiaceae bacterium]
GSVSYSAGWDPARAQTLISVLYVNRGSSPENVRFGALEFEDPDVDLLAGFIATPWADEELAAEFIVRQSSDEDVEGNLYAKFDAAIYAENEELFALFFVNQGSEDLLGWFHIPTPANQELLGAFNAQQAAAQNLLGQFEIRNEGANPELLAYFEMRNPDSEALLGYFGVSRDDWISKGLNVSVYQALGIIS